MHSPLPRKFYADPEFYRRELERFYFNRWICAGRGDQIPQPGDYFTRTVGDESIIITRDTSIPFGLSAIRNVGEGLVERIVAEREASGIVEGLVRLAVGLEHPDDIRADLERGLKA